ncbi:nitroimidazol reductase NimA-like FMN-containing flavoprotein (pyridoxamine 5'-phosphate oxidase superfamily) [Streptacidiphilus sp. MAP12-20]|uniref:pyridoxamine 5'-phosphate oxidase family protein n=1 Tax=Streptacidiphilus sp. MAP12-20 TaxID=3156299 RepID=UPI0035114E9D
MQRIEEEVAMRQDECVDLLSRSSVGRVVFTRHAIPDVLPVHFAYDDQSGTIRIPAPHASRLADAVDGTVVALHVEELDPATMSGRSVLVHGRAEAGTADAPIRLTPELITGRVLALSRSGTSA